MREIIRLHGGELWAGQRGRERGTTAIVVSVTRDAGWGRRGHRDATDPCCHHLGAVGAALHSVETLQAEAWVNHAKDVIWQEGPAALLGLLASCRAPTEEAAKTLDTERGYFRTNAERMRYSTYRDQGLPVGSGVVESAAKHLVQQRMKRAGMRWSELGARAILHLRCALLNHDLLKQAA